MSSASCKNIGGLNNPPDNKNDPENPTDNPFEESFSFFFSKQNFYLKPKGPYLLFLERKQPQFHFV